MEQNPIQLIRGSITRAELALIAANQFGDMVKAVVDIERSVMAIGAELHSDEEAALLEDGARQSDLWGINLYPSEAGQQFIEFDSMINIRPAQGNRSRGVEVDHLRARIQGIVTALVSDA
jgi:Protein of unknown function (DUF5674)